MQYVLSYCEPFYLEASIRNLIGVAAEQLSEATLLPEDLPSPYGFVWIEGAEQGAVQWFAWGIISDGIVVHYSRRALDNPHEEDIFDNTWYYAVTQKAEDELRFWQLLYSFFAFVRQRILTFSHERADRASRRRSGIPPEHQPLIRVIQLRAPKHNSQSSDHETHDWSCRWMVRGHWRNQPYPKDHAVRPKWIAPYVKGPDEAPLKPPRATVFAVIR